jgi:predicted ribosomally synthesized peptide with SipW-like signal peptide
MNRPVKLGMAAGTLGLGVATLALVGTGAFASFTAQVKDNTSITSGTFHMKAFDPLAYAHDPLIGVTPGTATVAGGTTNSVTFTQTNADPTATYKYQFTVYDSGSLSGVVNKLVYAPTSTPNTLMDHATILVEQCVHNTVTCSAVRTTLGNTTGWTKLTSHPTPYAHGSPPATFPAYESQTLPYVTPTGHSLNGFLNPNHTTGATTLAEEDSGWVTYRVIVSFSPTTPNGAEGQTFSFSLSATGHNI